MLIKGRGNPQGSGVGVQEGKGRGMKNYTLGPLRTLEFAVNICASIVTTYVCLCDTGPLLIILQYQKVF